SLPPVDGATLATPPPVEAAGADAALDAAADGDALAPQAARNALDAATPPTAAPRRSTSRREMRRFRTLSSVMRSLLPRGWPAVRRPDGPRSSRFRRRSRPW